MVFESLLDPEKAERKPYEMLFVGAIYASLAVLLCLFVFGGYGSFVLVALTMLACMRLMYGVLSIEEKKDKEIDHEIPLIKEHGRALSFFIFLFLGITITFTIWFLLLPAQSSVSMFETQLNTIKAINAPATGSFIDSSAFVNKIFLSNLKVLLLVILFSFFYGCGAIFILTWNASVIGAAMGSFIKANLGILSPGITGAAVYAGSFTMSIFRYFTHGIPEIAAYFLAALAGGIISVAIINHDFHSPKFKHIVADSFDLIMLSIAVLIAAAIIEVFVTPALF